MAEKRMFAKTIVDSDAFLDMPMSTQALYFHLGMRADDDGFVNSPKKIQKIVGAADDDMKLLIAKKFIIAFESGIIVIKHWRINNYLRSDRYTETNYKEEKATLLVDENNAYTQTNTLGIPLGIPLGNPDKNSIEKNRLDKRSKEEQVWTDAGADTELLDALVEFEKMRNTAKKKMTDRARLMLLKELEKISKGNTALAVKVLEQSILHCWQTVYPLKESVSTNSTAHLFEKAVNRNTEDDFFFVED